LRTAELTLPGFHHDICSAIHPLAAASPFFRTLDLQTSGLEWIDSPVALAHPFEDGTAALLCRSLDETTESLHAHDRAAYRGLMDPFLQNWEPLLDEILAPVHVPRSLSFAKFGLKGAQPASMVIRGHFKCGRARGMMAGLAAHSFLSLSRMPSAAFGLMLGLLAHAVGWPLIKGGSQQLAAALVARLQSLGGSVQTERPVREIRELEGFDAILLDVTPRQLLQLAPHQGLLRRTLLRRYRYGPGVFKIDWALSQPIPWKAAECGLAATVHIGGTLEEIERAESIVASGLHPQMPFVLLAQQSLFDGSRAPAGRHTGWAYCHVPNGSTVDMTEQIEEQVERFAPGFRECIISRATRNAAEHEVYNPNFIGGDINGGAMSLSQLFLRPTPLPDFYATGMDRIFLCSSSTPPGPGVHGMCGYHAGQAALRQLARER
jgi:phytoene dehydrogenase-like protein